MTSSRILVGACLSLSGNYARFGSQAARALQAWQAMDGSVELVIEDDESSTKRLEQILPRVADACDVLLGPYSTQLMKTAGRIAAEEDWLIWNQGGSGDDIEAAHPGHIVSVLTPTSRYAEPFLQRLASRPDDHELWIVHGKGSFGRQVSAGAQRLAANRGLVTTKVLTAEEFSSSTTPTRWDLFSVGRFEDDVETVRSAAASEHPPRNVCAVAAGVREFGSRVENPAGVFGVAQWAAGGSRTQPALGPNEAEFLTAYGKVAHATPDYPAVQAVAGALVAVDCARKTGGCDRSALWSAATELDTETFFGGFRIDPDTGTQEKHSTTLVQWTAAGDLERYLDVQDTD